MTTAFENELAATLHDLAGEVAVGADELATVAYRDGQRLRRRRAMLTAAASVVAFAVLAAPAVAATVIHDSHNPAARTGLTTTVSLHVAALPATEPDRSTMSDVLRKRLTVAGLRPISISSTTIDDITLVLPGRVPQTRIEPLLVPAVVQFRTVIAAVADIAPAQASPAPQVNPAAPTLAQVKAGLGSVYDLALTITDPSTVTPSMEARLAAFAGLSPAQVSVLPPSMQYAVPAISCAQLLARPSGSTLGTAVGSRITACGKDDVGGAMTKYLLDVATVGNADIDKAVAEYNDGGPRGGAAGWEVDLSFTGAGQRAWSTLTAQLYAQADPTASPPTYKQLAILVDATVVSAPQILAAIPGPATISGGFTKATATSLANLMGAKVLPAVLSITNVTVG